MKVGGFISIVFILPLCPSPSQLSFFFIFWFSLVKLESQLVSETHFCKSNTVLQIYSSCLDLESILYKLSLEASLDEKRNNQLITETLRPKMNRMNTNMFCECKAGRKPRALKQSSSQE